MSKYKYLVVTDLDHTLLNSRGDLTEETKDYVKKLRERGDVMFTFSTGRPLLYCKDIYEELEMDCFVSCNNGSVICNPKKNVFRYNYISEDFVRAALNHKEFMEHFHDGTFNTDIKRYVYEAPEVPQAIDYLDNSGASVFSCRFQFDLGETEEESRKRMDEKIRLLKTLGYDVNIIAYVYPDFISMEAISKLSSKEASAQFLACYYGVSHENVLTFGDEINDLSVAMGKTRFYAMANSVGILKQHARILSKYSNNQEGVVRELQEFFADK